MKYSFVFNHRSHLQSARADYSFTILLLFLFINNSTSAVLRLSRSILYISCIFIVGSGLPICRDTKFVLYWAQKWFKPALFRLVLGSNCGQVCFQVQSVRFHNKKKRSWRHLLVHVASPISGIRI